MTTSFNSLKPICVSLLEHNISKSTKKQHLDSLLQILKNLTNEKNITPNPQLADYVFFPLSQILKNNSFLDDRTIELIFSCISILVKSYWSYQISFELLKQLLILVSFITKKSNTNNLISIETKISCVNLLNSLFITCSQSQSCLIHVHDSNFLLILSDLIFFLLTNLQDKNSNTDLKIYSLNSLNNCLFSLISDADLIANILPGITSSITKSILKSTPSPHYKVISKSIDILTRCISITFLDQDFPFISEYGLLISQENILQNELQKLNSQENSLQNKIYNHSQNSQITRNYSWLNASREQLRIAIGSILNLRNHQRDEVRNSLANLAINILQKSHKSLHLITNSLIEVLFVFSSDDSSYSQNSFSFLLLEIPKFTPLKDSSKIIISNTIKSLPSVLDIHDQHKRQNKLNQITTAIKLWDAWEPSSPVLIHFIKSNLSNAIKFPLPPASIREGNITSMEIQSLKKNLYTPIDVLNTISNSEINSLAYSSYSSLYEIFKTVSHSSASRSIIAAYIENAIFASGYEKCTYLWCSVKLTEYFYNTSSNTDQDVELIESLYYECLNVLKTANELQNEFPDLEPYLISIALSGVLIVSNHSKVNFTNDLIHVLYPIVYLLSSNNLSIRSQAQNTLIQICYNCNYTSIYEMFNSNFDYLIDAISLTINSFDLSPQNLSILRTLIQIIGPPIIPYIDDTIRTLFKTLDSFQGYSSLVISIFLIFKEFLIQSVVSIQSDINKLSYGENRRLTNFAIDLNDVIKDLNKKKNILNASKEEKDSNEKDIELEHEKNKENEFLQQFSKLNSSKDNDTLIESINDEVENLDHKKNYNDMENKEENEDKKEDIEDYEDSKKSDVPTKAEWNAPISKSLFMLIQDTLLYAQYYLTHSSAEVRFTILEMINISIPLLNLNKTELLTTINKLWPSVIRKLEDENILVIVTTLKVISNFCLYAGDFMSSRINDSWNSIKSLFIKLSSFNLDKYSKQEELTIEILNAFSIIITSVKLDFNVFGDMLETFGPFLNQYTKLKDSLCLVNEDAVWLHLNNISKSD